MHAGDLAFVHGDHDAAVARLDAALALARELGDPDALAYALLNRGLTALGCNQDERARALWEEALPLFRAQGDAGHVAAILDNLGTIARRQGDPTRALALHEEALALSRDLRIAWLEPNVLGHVAGAATDLGDYRRAAALYRESLRRVWEGGDRRHFAGILAGFAGLVAACGQPERAARLCGAAAGLVEAVGATLSPAGQTNFERAEAAARTGAGGRRVRGRLGRRAGHDAGPGARRGEVAVPVPPERPGARERAPGRTERVVRADRAGAGGPAAAGRGPLQPRDRRRAVHQPEDRRRPRHQHLAKLGVASRAAAIAFAHRHGLV